MRFEITPEGDNLLPLVTHLPSEQVSQLEGYNGVGKTLTAIVLQICTGTQPVITSEQQARWEGLREGLGRIRVIADELADGRTIEWHLDSRLWPADVTRAIEVTDEWFAVSVDGRAASLAEAQQVLGVERIAGTDGLLETLADEADAERARVEAFGLRVADRREELEQLVSELAAFLGRSTPARTGPKRPEWMRLGRQPKPPLHVLATQTVASRPSRGGHTARTAQGTPGDWTGH